MWGQVAGGILATVLVTSAGVAQERVPASEGMIAYVSDVPFTATTGRVESAVTSRDLRVMQVLDHSGAAARLGEDISPNLVVLFGNPQTGSQLMACAPRVGIDLPQKLLVWEENGTVYVGYNDPWWLVSRHSIEGCDEVIGRVAETLDAIARDVASET